LEIAFVRNSLGARGITEKGFKFGLGDTSCKDLTWIVLEQNTTRPGCCSGSNGPSGYRTITRTFLTYYQSNKYKMLNIPGSDLGRITDCSTEMFIDCFNLQASEARVSLNIRRQLPQSCTY
jgi:hypothetical protein